mmetsp:Transcript_29330/g.91411  ORF Transcript_29330/g.91411 Transcript_29330/m.91411 type:complete len:338 (+) Transcript_29330:66-1079(+)
MRRACQGMLARCLPCPGRGLPWGAQPRPRGTSGARPEAAVPQVVAFAGLGAMGYPMAGHVAKLPVRRCLVWNRTAEKARRHAEEHGSVQVAEALDLGQAEVLLLCLPTSAEDVEVAEQVAPRMAPGACIVSCTSGEPAATRRLATSLRERFGIHFIDCPVSGGPRGAAAGSLACLLGADDEGAVERVRPVVKAFARQIVRCGPSGAGHAVKSVNNALNVTHLMLATEGLLALRKLGVDPAVALEAINGSSGRSLQTEQRLPQEVLTGRFEYGFKLPLMAKDCRIAEQLLAEGFPGATLLPAGARLVQQAAAEESEDADYTCVVRMLESQAGVDLRAQ